MISHGTLDNKVCSKVETNNDFDIVHEDTYINALCKYDGMHDKTNTHSVASITHELCVEFQ